MSRTITMMGTTTSVFATYYMGHLYHTFLLHFIRWWPLIQRILPGS
jgi:hypothetical protein